MFSRNGLALLAATCCLLAKAGGAPFVFTSPYQGDPAGGTAQPGQEQPLGPDTSAPPSRRDSLTGDWFGLRPRLAEAGVAFTPIYQAEVFGNTGGARQGVIFDGLFNFALDLDLERLTGFWPNATIHANALYVHGPNLSARYVGDFSTTSNIAGYNSVRLQELWLEQNFWEKRFSIRAGLITADSEFFTSDSSGLFLDSTFGAFPLISADFTDAPIYPVANPGVRLSFASTAGFYFKGAVFGMDSSSDQAGNNAHGTHFHLKRSDGALLMGELGWQRNQAADARGMRSTYKLGGFAQRGQYASFDSQAKDALGLGRLSGQGTNYAVYAVADQEIYKAGDRSVTVFARGGLSSARLSFVDRYVDAGFNCTGLLPGRPDDVAGIAVSYAHVSHDFSEAEQAQGRDAYSHEAVVEATYKIVLAPWWSLQPDFQYIFNPSGVEHSRDALVFGLRTTVAF